MPRGYRISGQSQILPTTGGVDRILVESDDGAGDVRILVDGTSTNANVKLVPKGTGGVAFPDGAVATPGIYNDGDRNTGVYFSAADTVDVTAGGVRVATFDAAGVTMQTAGDGIVPAAVSGTPAQHALYQENVPKGWAMVTVSAGTPTLADSFNVSGITDTGAGQVTVTWDRDFANATYAVSVALDNGATGQFPGYGNQLAGSVDALAQHVTLALTDPAGYHVIAIGDQ